MGEESRLHLDLDTLLDDADGDPDADPLDKVHINTKQHSMMATEQQEQQQSQELVDTLTDRELQEKIQNYTDLFTNLSAKLPDKGDKLRATLKRYKDEAERREQHRLDKDVFICEKPTQSNNLSFAGSSNGYRQEDVSSQGHSNPPFGTRFIQGHKVDKNKTDCKPVNASDKKLSSMGRCERKKVKQNGKSSPKKRQKTRQQPFQCPINRSLDKGQRLLSNGDQKGRASSVPHIEDFASCFTQKKDAFQVLPSNDTGRRKGQTIVLVDEEEPQHAETIWEMDKPADCLKDTNLKDTKIYYPSRDDAESVEICPSDIKCLAPEAFLTSTIMNFYIRYLQQTSYLTERAQSDYHFFNTYFYKKLKEAVSYKGSDQKTSFLKFRRWWKGVNIFQKAYILLPIHEDLHWSLVIICIPDKEEESGPIILHLDSLGFHFSKKIFDNIKSYLTHEWEILKEEEAPQELSLVDKIWRNLPRRIEEKVIPVPQQRNDYDCGLFVLLFMKRFMEEAPERLKKNDLDKFNRQWFKPVEASSLRGNIKSLLMKEFQKALLSIHEDAPIL